MDQRCAICCPAVDLTVDAAVGVTVEVALDVAVGVTVDHSRCHSWPQS